MAICGAIDKYGLENFTAAAPHSPGPLGTRLRNGPRFKKKIKITFLFFFSVALLYFINSIGVINRYIC